MLRRFERQGTRPVAEPEHPAQFPGAFDPRHLRQPAEIADAGDFEKNQSFSIGAWVKVSGRGNNGAIAARMNTGPGYQGWDLWMEQDKIGMHIISAWPDNALKVVAQTPLQPRQWVHVLATYDGSGKAAGVKVYLNGVPQPVDVQMDTLKSSIKTLVPFKVGQRNTGDRLPFAALHVRPYGSL